jgi:hypothetical protein
MRKAIAAGVVSVAVVASITWLFQSAVMGQADGSSAQSASKFEVPRTAWGHPDLQGVWDPTTGTPLERPPQYNDREFLTDEEAAERERTRFAQFDSPDRGPRNPTGDYGSVWREGSKNALNRTSLIIDPPDGRLPPFTAAAKEKVAARQMQQRNRGPADDWTDLPLWTRCITRGTPRIPNNYNSNLHIVQIPERVTIHYEMIHETRTIWLDGRPHLSSGIRLWNGDARGRWEENTLVVETRNFNAQQEFAGSSMATATLTERFTRIGPDEIDYRFTIDDPATYTRPLTVIQPMVRNTAPYYEYACHEFNYGLRNILTGARAEERAGKTLNRRYGDEGAPSDTPIRR